MDNENNFCKEIDNLIKKTFSINSKSRDDKVTKRYKSRHHHLILRIDEEKKYIYVWISGDISGLFFEKEYLFSEKSKALRDFRKNMRIINLKEVFI